MNIKCVPGVKWDSSLELNLSRHSRGSDNKTDLKYIQTNILLFKF